MSHDKGEGVSPPSIRPKASMQSALCRSCSLSPSSGIVKCSRRADTYRPYSLPPHPATHLHLTDLLGHWGTGAHCGRRWRRIARPVLIPFPLQHNLPPNLGGGTVFLLEAIDHPQAPPEPRYARAKILLGMNLVQPVDGDPFKCKFTFTQQVDPGGAIPAWVMNRFISREAVQFFDRIARAARRHGG